MKVQIKNKRDVTWCHFDNIKLYTLKNCNIKRSSLQFTINDSEFKQTAVQWGFQNKEKIES